MRSHLLFLVLSITLSILVMACCATAAEGVDPNVVGVWQLAVPGPGGKAIWIWDIRANGTYEFRIEGLGAQGGHSGKLVAKNGQWTLTATTMKYADGGKYRNPDPNTFIATGQLGTASWTRKAPAVVTNKKIPSTQKSTTSPSSTSRKPSSGSNPFTELTKNLKKATTVKPGVKAYLLGLDALESGKWSEALQQFKAALQHEPENPDYFVARGVGYTFSQKLKEAEQDFKRANRLRGNHKPTKMWWATVVGMQGRYDEDGLIYPPVTRDHYENAIRKLREYGELSFWQGEEYADPEQLSTAREKQNEAIRSFPRLAKMFVEQTKPAGSRATGGPKGGLSTILRQRGIDRYKAGQYPGAYRDLSHAYQANPDDKEVLFYLAECKRILGSPEGARADYTAVLLEQPNHAKAILGRALAHASLGDAPAARRGLDKVRKIDRTLGSQYDKQITNALTNFRTAPNEQRKAALLEQLRKSAQQDANRDTLRQLAERVVKVSNYGRLRADEQYQMKLTDLRRTASRRNATADDFAALGQYLYEQALIVVGEAVEPRARNRPYRPQTKKGQDRELALAEVAVDHALKLNPNHPRALAFKGACRFKRANAWVTAEKYLSRAIDLDSKDPVIQDLFAVVLDYIAFVQASAASGLRAVDTWEDTHYIYYRYPSEAEIRRANELDAIARRMWKKARRALEQAIVSAPNSAHAYYYRSILSERDKDRVGAATWLKKALELDPKFFEAAQRLSTIAHKNGQTQLAYTAQSIATNLVHTSAAPMLKLSWIEFKRTAFNSASKVLNIAANLDPSDPRVAAYQGSVARETGDHALAESWFLAAAALEEVRLLFLGLNVREQKGMDYRPNDISRWLAINNAAATEQNQQGHYQQTLGSLGVNFNIYDQSSLESKYTKTPYALLPEKIEDPSRIPEAPTIETLILWSTIHAAKANGELKRYDTAMKQYEWAAAFESRKPPAMEQGMAVRIPGLWARLGMVDIELRKGNGKAASDRMGYYGKPSIATPAMKAEADRIRNAIEDLGFSAGTDMRDRKRRERERH